MTARKPVRAVKEYQPHPHVGKIYKFNQVLARVVFLDEKIVRWREMVFGRNLLRPRMVRTINQTPRWYFEQHASVTLHYLVERKRVTPIRRKRP